MPDGRGGLHVLGFATSSLGPGHHHAERSLLDAAECNGLLSPGRLYVMVCTLEPCAMCAGFIPFIASENNIFLHVVYLTRDRRSRAKQSYYVGAFACLSPHCVVEHIATCNGAVISKKSDELCGQRDEQTKAWLTKKISIELIFLASFQWYGKTKARARRQYATFPCRS